jgi:nucleoside 2-deoxyribosyltransferase
MAFLWGDFESNAEGYAWQMKSIYLAGPDVFFRDAAAHFDRLEARCAAHGLRGVRPSDGGLSSGFQGSGEETAQRIYRENLELVRGCDGLLANSRPTSSWPPSTTAT